MIFLLIHRSSPSKYSLRFLILPELVTIPKDSKGNLQERPHSYLYKQKRWKLHIKTNKQHPKSHPSKSSRDNQLSKRTRVVYILSLPFAFSVRSSWVIVQSKSIWNKPNVSNLTSDILRWKKHIFRKHSLQRQSVYTTLSYCTEVRLKIRTKKTGLLRISIGSKAPRDRVRH